MPILYSNLLLILLLPGVLSDAGFAAAEKRAFRKNTAALANETSTPPHHTPEPRTAYADTSTTGIYPSSQ
jgi:hypothetical protein